MHLFQNSHFQASTLLCGLLTVAFILWLTNVMVQYDKETTLEQPEITLQPSPSHIVVEPLMLPAVPKPKLKPRPKSKPRTSAVSTHDKSLVVTVTEVLEQATPPADQQQIEHVYQELNDEDMQLQIAWPQQAGERQETLDFMYQCVGMQFAVLNENTLITVNHSKLNQTSITNYSEWIRIAQGSLSEKEQHWLHAYALTGIPVRLFPRQLDWRLAQYLANTLQGLPLSSLEATYLLTNQRLQLTNIHINQQPILDNWVLYQGKC